MMIFPEEAGHETAVFRPNGFSPTIATPGCGGVGVSDECVYTRLLQAHTEMCMNVYSVCWGINMQRIVEPMFCAGTDCAARFTQRYLSHTNFTYIMSCTYNYALVH